MTCRAKCRVLALSAVLWTTGAATAAAAPDACSGPVIRSSPELERRWGATLSQVRLHLSSARDVDRCAEVDLLSDGEAVLVVIKLADGRTATRRADSALSAMATVEALLTVLPEASVAPVVETRPEQHVVAPVPVQPPTAQGALALDLGIGAATRLTVDPTFVGYGLLAYASVAIKNWLLGSWIRWDFKDHPVGMDVPRRFAASSFLLGAFTGRRFLIRRAALDVLVGPNLVVDDEESRGATESGDVGGDVGGLSLGSSLRLILAHGQGPSAFAQLGGEVYPHRLEHLERADPSLPALPPWSFGFAIGASWSVL